MTFYITQERRPFLASDCDDLPAAEKWRREIIREIAKKVAQIQNAGLGEFRLRDLNDEINKLLREKRYWQDRIKELGGPDYAKVGPKMLDREGKEVPGNRGYKYFGAAKDLPGVRELFEQEKPEKPRRTRGELYRHVDADYYGYRDEDDGVIVPLEKEAEASLVAAAVKEWNAMKERGEIPEDKEEQNIYAVADTNDNDNGEQSKDKSDQSFAVHVPVPSQKEVEELLVKRKKMELLHKYSSDTLLANSNEAKVLLGLN
ncbi:uncharacterized protein TRIADDRAFT_23391 [Trichoplax adhaerens]|uniref:Pre-mRNA-splicing factor ISY1 homolog n=1 Tax=Trichoplax adhaerens TaxID=10228 RepID=B3RV12_TRIAD|nr:hypothetical protein TRIADDRAFT_23391 [Trichoplax adhaerens]EDV25919.1 hypothetical protein TRIADDRAFT_23391 [Trichoplax adhaerens]|eukprot:XP_002111952.1 hypothetical protein TRIADDRAFT_23391 [Trichoplax adhaerens]